MLNILFRIYFIDIQKDLIKMVRVYIICSQKARRKFKAMINDSGEFW